MNSSITTIPIQTLDENSFIGFFHEYDKYGEFSNWYPAEFDYAGVHFYNVEQYMMYYKALTFRAYDLAARILKTKDPAECKKLGRSQIDGFDAHLWDDISRIIVRRGIKAKFSQNPEIQKTLLSTGNALLAECSPYDKIWGIGIGPTDPMRFHVSAWNGENKLGITLMEVRDYIRRAISTGKTDIFYLHDIYEAEPIDEWKLKAGELASIPQFKESIDVYSKTIRAEHARDTFLYEYTLEDWDIAMKTNMGGGLPIVGFYEMKQDIYEIVSLIRG